MEHVKAPIKLVKNLDIFVHFLKRTKKYCIKMILLHSHLIHEKDANTKVSLFQP